MTWMIVRKLICSIPLLLPAASFATPITLFEQAPDLDDNGGFLSTLAGRQQTADEFRLSASAMPNQLTWWGYGGIIGDPNPTLDFVVRLYRDAGGLPEEESFFEQTILSARGTFYGTSWMSNGLTADIYGYSSAIDMPVLEADTTYWLSVVGINYFIWGNAQGGLGTQVATRYTGASFWNPQEDTHRAAQAFRLDSVSVPEPSAFHLTLVAFAISLLVRRRSFV